MAKLKKSSGKKMDDATRRFLLEAVAEVRSSIAAEVDEKVEQGCLRVRTELGDVIAGLAQNIINGKTDARSLANVVAKVIAPTLRDYLNKSFSQKGDGILGAITKAQRNT